ncbi:tetratricopeptide repeat protein [Marinivivus vitaminiproducens]|uniref:tetratricopeptide repeat protein n=1 Tax=Marinivivus vitaminiproducens TaxID=3035935 RepID=UPI0027A1A5B2|nr:tetratricopeptide repeat protein [Geminicoccaceae bacterium SCSIO 64248]
MSENFMREVDEEVRRARLQTLATRYGPLLGGVALVVVLAVGGYELYRWWDRSQRHDQALDFAAAQQLAQAGNAAEAAPAFAAVADEAGAGYRGLARLQAVKAYRQAGDDEAARAQLALLAGDDGVAKDLRDLAATYAVMSDFASLDPDAIGARLASLTDGDDTWRYAALEIEALSALRSGDRDGAIAGLRGLQDDLATPQGMRARADELLSALGAGPASDATDAPETPPAAGEAQP